MPAEEVRGDLQRTPEGNLQGWCWSPSRRDARLSVELLINDRPAGERLADQHRPDLASVGVGDGRHGFTFASPAVDWGVLSAREVGSGTIFGRVALPGPPIAERLAPRLDAIGTALAELAEAVDTLSRRPDPVTMLRGALDGCATSLAARAGLAICREQVTAQRLPRLRLPGRAGWPRGRPRSSVLLPAAASLAETRRVLAQLVPVLVDTDAELLLLDAGRADHAFIGTAVSNLRVVADIGEALAPHAARGARVIWLHGSDPSPAGLAAVLASEVVLLGGRAAAAASALGVVACAGRLRAAGPVGLAIAIDRVLLDALGLDPVGGDDLRCADLCLRARLAGVPTAVLDEPDSHAVADIAMGSWFVDRWTGTAA